MNGLQFQISADVVRLKQDLDKAQTQSDSAQGQRLGTIIANAVKATIVNEKRAGGLLAR